MSLSEAAAGDADKRGIWEYGAWSYLPAPEPSAPFLGTCPWGERLGTQGLGRVACDLGVTPTLQDNLEERLSPRPVSLGEWSADSH